MTDQDLGTERVTVRTYVPKYQRDRWDAEAERLDMSRSEFVRSMVQAGRSGFFEGDATTEESVTGGDEDTTDGDGPAETGQAADLETQVVETLTDSAHLSWDELLGAVTDDIEDRLEATLQHLQAADRVRYSGRNGGYTLDE